MSDLIKPVAWLCEYYSGEEFTALAMNYDPMGDTDVRSAIPLYTRDQLDAAVANAIDCRTCRNFRATAHCHSVLKCVNGSAYQATHQCRMWEEA